MSPSSSAQFDLPARTGETDPSGKLGLGRVDIKCSEELEDALIMAAGVEGITKAEYARRILEIHMFGVTTFIRRRVASRL